MANSLNIAVRLTEAARAWPDVAAVVVAGRRRRYRETSFAELESLSNRLAGGLLELGVEPGHRIVLMVRPGLEFIAMVFALFKTRAVVVLVDPGMGLRRVAECLERTRPQGFVAVPAVQLARLWWRRRFPDARLNVTVGWPALGGRAYRRLAGGSDRGFETVETAGDDPAAIIFTSGGTGPPKGVVYEHAMFGAQADWLREFYEISPGEIDLPGFPLFSLFNVAMGVTSVVPAIDPTRPAQVDPRRIVDAILDRSVTQAFGSPALWDRVGRYCRQHDVRLPSLKRVLSAGAPVPPAVIETMREALAVPQADVHTPYGATEALPVCSLDGATILAETAAESRGGAGTCVGRTFPGIELRIVEIPAGPIRSADELRDRPAGEIGEILVRGAVVTRRYNDQPGATRQAKVPDPDGFWHRMGDVGYLDDSGRLWFCGRVAHVVRTANGPLFSVRCEAIFNEHPRVARSALVGLGNPPDQLPAMVVEPTPGNFPGGRDAGERLAGELRELGRASPLTAAIERFAFHRSLPVDVRHNVKIDREALARWAAGQSLIRRA